MLLGPRVSSDDAQAAAEAFAENVMRHDILPGARAQIAADRAAGYRLVLATASYRFYAQEIGRRLGFDDVIGTGVVTDASGAILPRIDGENCYGPAKRRMVEAWMAREGLRREDCLIRFYSDHVSDAPMFEFADAAIAVNAHGPLRTLASRRGWQQFDWR